MSCYPAESETRKSYFYHPCSGLFSTAAILCIILLSSCNTGKLITAFRTVILCIILLSCLSRACSETLNFRNYSVKNGLANSTVYDIFQDSKGFIWFATESGINRFDGQKFELFTMDNGLSDNEVLQIHEDSRGRIWFLTLNGRLSYYYNRKFYNPVNEPFLRKVICAGSLMSFFEDSQHRLWFSTNQNSLLRIGPGNSVKFFSPSDHSLANCFIAEDKDHGIVALNKDQALLLKGDRFIPLQTENFRFLSRPASGTAAGESLFLSDKGLVQFWNRKFNLLFKLNEAGNIQTGGLLIDNPEKIWVGTIGDGLLLFQAAGRQPENHLKGQSITDIMKDAQGNIWISTIGDGVYMLPFYSAADTHFTAEDGLSNNAVNSILKVKGELFLGLRNGNLDIVTSGEKIVHRIFNPSNIYSPVKQLYYDKDRRSVWCASENSLLEIFSDGSYTNILKDRNKNYALKSFSISSKGEIAIALASGVYITTQTTPLKFDLKNNPPAHPHFHNRAFTVFYDSHDRLWFSNIQGLQYYYQGKVTALFQKFPDLRQRITDIRELPDKRIVCTSYGFGVFILKDDKPVKIITTANGLASNICKRVFLENGNAWIVTGKGVSKINCNTPDYKVDSYNTENGIISDEVNDVFAQNNTVYVATNNGVSVFKPSSYTRQKSPQIYLKNVLANKQAFKPGKHSFLSYHQNNITVDYIALDYAHPDRIVYSYRLDRSLKWNETQGTSIEFGSLEPDSYHLEIRAKSLNTSWSEPLTIDFTIKPPFWKSTWFILAAALAAGGLLFLLIRYYFRSKQVKEKEKLLVKTRIISLEQQALQAMMNPHFIFNVMNSIQYFINTRENAMANHVLTGFARLIRKNLDICNKSYISVEEEISYLNLYLSLEKLRFGDKMSYSIDVDKEIDLQETYIPSMLLQPYVENAIWHGIMPKDSPGSIQISIRKGNGVLHIKITDDGIGIDNSLRLKSSEHVSQGMKLTMQRVNLLNKFKQRSIKINITSIPAGGTEVAVDVPLKPFTN